MTTHTIIGETKGSPDNSQNTLLHTYNQILSTGARVAQGDGTGLGLVLWTNSIGVENAFGYNHRLFSNAGENRDVNLPDQDGLISVSQTAKLTSDFTTTSALPQEAAGLSQVLDSNSTYRVSGYFLAKAANHSHPLHPRVTAQNGTVDSINLKFSANNEAIAVNSLDTDAEFSTFNTPDNTPEIITVEGILDLNASFGYESIAFEVSSKTDSHSVTLMKNSFISYTKI